MFRRVFINYFPMIGKIYDWQMRELYYMDFEKPEPEKMTSIYYDKDDLKMVKNLLSDVKKKYKPLLGRKQYSLKGEWETSRDALNCLHSCVITFPVAVWELMRRAGFNSKDIGLVYVNNHFCVGWHQYSDDEDFWVLDNSYITKKIVKASELFPIEKDEKIFYPTYGFNDEDFWHYKNL